MEKWYPGPYGLYSEALMRELVWRAFCGYFKE